MKNKIVWTALPVALLVFMAFRYPWHGSGAGDPAFEPYEQELHGSSESIPMQPVSGGRFTMGNSKGEENERPSHEVAVEDFWMGAYEITWDQYEQFAILRNNVRDENIANETRIEIDAISSPTTPYVDMSHGMGKAGYPVVNVTQYAALGFCKWLSAKTGRFYRLPTEAEWEYACRAGSSEEYSFGNDSALLSEYAWYKGNSGTKYHKVGLKKPNQFGLYDMHGNVAEWTMDQYVDNAYLQRADSLLLNPWIRPVELYPRVVRGGSWEDPAEDLRASSRQASTSEWKRIDPQVPRSRWWFTNAAHLGFRIVRPRVTPPPGEIEKYWLEAIDEY